MQTGPCQPVDWFARFLNLHFHVYRTHETARQLQKKIKANKSGNQFFASLRFCAILKLTLSRIFAPMKLQDNLRIAINSTAYYILSYLFVFLVHQSATILASFFFDYNIQVNYSKILFMVSRYDWSSDSVKIIFSAGPLACLIISIFMIVVVYRYKEFNGSLKLFFLWGFVHSISIFLGSAYAGALLGEGFGHVLIWMFMPDTGKLIITLISLFLLAATGLALTRIFLLSGNIYFNLLETKNRLPFVFFQVILPFIIGSLIIIAIRFPVNLYELLRILTPILVILTVLLSSFGFSVLYFDESPRKIKINGNLLVAAFIIYAAYRIALHFPVMI